VRVISWNVAKRVSRLAEQAAALAGRSPDVVALQEVNARTWPLWRAALETIGMPCSACSLDSADPAREPAARRRGGVVLAAREPLGPAEPLGLPRAETALAATVDGIAVHTVHVPYAGNGWVKVDTLAAVRAGLAAGAGPRILCGDLNTPRRELPDGDVLSFAHDSAGRLRPERGERWDRAERALVHDLRRDGWLDAFRCLHGYGEREASWTFAHDRGGWRLDHVLVRGLRPLASAYAHDWRRAGLSDHSALVVDLER
jgi:exonuclease III